MATFNLDTFNANRKANNLTPVQHVMSIDDNNVILAWRDTGVYQGRAYDKYRLGAWYWSNRNGTWQQGTGSLSVPWGQREALLTALARLAALIPA